MIVDATKRGKRFPDSFSKTVPVWACKLALNWYPLKVGGRESEYRVFGNRFVMKDGSSIYMTANEFDSYMWHHAMITVAETGEARLVVDGVVQELLQNVELDLIHRDFGLGEPAGTSVNVRNYPNRCVQTTSPDFRSRSRRSLIDQDGFQYETKEHQNVEYGSWVKNGFLTGYNAISNVTGALEYTSVENGELGAYTETECFGGPSCTFKMAVRCPDDSTQNFDGLLDEVAVWNRALSIDEIQTAMFKMAANKLLDTQTAGIQVDVTAGRVLYARFNNPCMEGPVPVPPPPAPMPNFGALRVASTPSERVAKAQQQLRRLGISDDASLTAGYITATGRVVVTDDMDAIVPIRFRESASYAFTGVPWEAPLVKRRPLILVRP